MTTTSRPTRRPSSRPDPARLAALLVQVWVDVRAGRRSFRQLRVLTAPALERQLTAQLVCAPRGPRATVRRVTTCCPRDGVCEAAVTIQTSTRVTAVAVRLEIHRGVWRAVELTAPEAGFAPLRTASAPLRIVTDAFDEALTDTDARHAATRPGTYAP
ncbi:MAG: Rv3235 family protein [Nitriliruptoraceae bacterium]